MTDLNKIAGFLKPRLTKFIPHKPTIKQTAFLLVPQKEALFGGAAGGGKALCVDTPLVTPTGWTTMGCVKPGDELIGADGLPTKVLAVSGVMFGHDCFKITFSDGVSIVADADHVWIASRTGRRKPKYQQITTRELSESVGRPWFVDLTKPIVFQDNNLPIDPYVFGVWLGDGDTRRGYITIHTDDREIIDIIESRGWSCERINGRFHVRVVGLSKALKNAGIIGPYRKPIPKRIPQNYLRSSLEQRLELLRGVIDTDGHIDKRGQIEITLVSKGLVDDIIELLMTLGIKATANESRAMLNGKDCGPRWRIKFVAPFKSAHLSRKANRQIACKHRPTTTRRVIVSVEPVKSVPVQCVKVDNHNGMFLAGREMVPTHNSDALLMAALQYSDVPGYACMLMRKTLADLKLPNALLSRATEWLTPHLRTKEVRYSASDHAFYFKTYDSKGKRLQDSSLTFGYIGDTNAYSRYQGIELQMVGFDEVTQHSEADYTYLFSRLRKCNCHDHKQNYDPDCNVCRMMASLPIRMRATTNPGGVGHRWVQARFKIQPEKQTINDREVVRWVGKDKTRPFIPSFLNDNPFLNQEEYNESLSNLTEEHRAQLQDGDWGFVANARFQQKYQRFFSESGDLLFLGPNRTGTHLNWQRDIAEVFQTIDSASSLTEGPGDTDFNPRYNPSWTVISTWAITKCYNLLWLHMERFREEIPEVIDRMWEQYYRWRPSKVIIEENGIGKGVVQYANRLGMVVEGVFKDTDKLRDATVAIIQMKNGRIWFPQYSDWGKTAENEIFTWQGYPNETDDIVDTLSRACNYVKWHNVLTKPESYSNMVSVDYHDLPGTYKPSHPLY